MEVDENPATDALPARDESTVHHHRSGGGGDGPPVTGEGEHETLKPRQVIIWKDRNRSIQLLNVLSGEEEEMAMDYLDHEPLLVYAKFMHAYHCYDLIPTSSKIVVLDTRLNVKKAFLALIYNGVRAAPLWNAADQKYIGMLTITDFIRILHQYYKQPGADMMELEEHKISTWRDVLIEYTRPIIYLHPEASLFEAIQKLHQHRVHRLPVIDKTTGNALFIVTHKRILRFLFLYLYEIPEPDFMHKTLAELNLGTFEDLATAKADMSVIDAINLFVERRVSALPVIDDNRQVIDVYAKFDVINVAAEKAYNDLSITIAQSMKNRRESFEGVQMCKKTETLKVVMERIAKAEVHRLIVVNEDGQLEGIVSLSDILHFLILKPSASRESSSPPP